MSKKAHERALDENEAQAVAKMLRVSPQKLNLVAGLIRGKKVATALADLVVAEAHVGKAIVLKRFSPRGRGRMGKIMKPFANLTIVVRQVEEAAAQAKA
jgi:large subunit ribosomal protein L22